MCFLAKIINRIYGNNSWAKLIIMNKQNCCDNFIVNEIKLHSITNNTFLNIFIEHFNESKICINFSCYDGDTGKFAYLCYNINTSIYCPYIWLHICFPSTVQCKYCDVYSYISSSPFFVCLLNKHIFFIFVILYKYQIAKLETVIGYIFPNHFITDNKHIFF